MMRGRFGVRLERGLRGDSRQVPVVAGAARPRARSARGSGVGIEEHVGSVVGGAWWVVEWGWFDGTSRKVAVAGEPPCNHSRERGLRGPSHQVPSVAGAEMASAAFGTGRRTLGYRNAFS